MKSVCHPYPLHLHSALRGHRNVIYRILETLVYILEKSWGSWSPYLFVIDQKNTNFPLKVF